MATRDFGYRFHGPDYLTERLAAAHPQDIDAPLNTALHSGHLNIALFLPDRGANGENGEIVASQTALYTPSSRGYAEFVRSLIDRGADPKGQSATPWMSVGGHVRLVSLSHPVFGLAGAVRRGGT